MKLTHLLTSDFGQAIAGASSAKTKVICHQGDNICEHGDLILIPHLTYGENAEEAATFVSAQAGLAMGDLGT
jgi:cutinase